jgi:hypothetical protein
MRKTELVLREVLYQALERKNRVLTQLGLARSLGVSLSTVNYALAPLRNMNAVAVGLRNFRVIDAKKMLYYWASIRNLRRDIIYSTRADFSVRDIESRMPDSAVYAAYSAFRFRFDSVPADYSEVYVYCDAAVEKRFPRTSGQPNVFVLAKDPFIDRYGKITTLAQTFVDLWNLDTWYARDFLKELEARLDGILE